MCSAFSKDSPRCSTRKLLASLSLWLWPSFCSSGRQVSSGGRSNIMAVGTEYLAEQPKLRTSAIVLGAIAIAALLAAPFFFYPVLLMSILCFALFACAFNLLIGYVGLLSFGHAAFFGWASYVAAHLAKVGTIQIPYWAGKWLVVPLPPLSTELAIIGGTLAAAVLGLIAGSIAI